jgi:lipopolysaccharide export system protein LptA
MHLVRLLFLFTLLLIGAKGFSQTPEIKEEKPKEIELIHADKFTVDKKTPKGASKLVGSVKLRHQEAFMYCDSAYLYDNNSLDAYGHVKIEEGDSLVMTGDSLFYDGNKKLARVRGRVRIDNKASVLTTPFLDYYRETSMAHYYGGGTIDSEKEKTHLVSKIGYYFSDIKLFHFKTDVVMTHPDYVIHTDTMHYAPDREKTWFFGPTTIDSDNKSIYCERGWYDQLNDKAEFIKNAEINSSGQTMKGDTIEYDQATEIGISKCNVVLIDTNEKFEVNGDYAIYYEKDSTSYVTKNVILKQDMEGDTFFLTADTLYSLLDTAGNRIMKTYHHSIFYKSDMQGACDSLYYHTKDSIIYMFHDPILWSTDNQITADSIRMTMKNGVMDKMYMDKNAFIIAYEDSIFYNQIKGRNMIGHFEDEALRKVDVFGNGETIYYPREEDNSLIGVNETKCSTMSIYIDSNTIYKITFYDKPVAKIIPTDEMPIGGKKLDGFNYRTSERPVSSIDILNKYLALLNKEMIALDSSQTDSVSGITTDSILNEVEKVTQEEIDATMKEAIDLLSPSLDKGTNQEGIKEED